MDAALRNNLLLIDADRCIGCLGCVVACRMENDLPAGPRPIKVLISGPFEQDEGCCMTYQPVTCYHCDRPACVPACPTGAMQKNEDGIVFSDSELCIGCQTCAVACPFGVPELNPATGKIVKCDGCRERTALDLWPACVLTCPTGSLIFGPAGRVVHELRLREALRTAGSFPSR